MNAQPIPGIQVKQAAMSPAPGQVIVSYMVIDPELGCCKCNDLTGGGVALLVIGLIVFWPIALIPCFNSDCKNKSQVPVYGWPGGVAPMAQPVVYAVQPAYAPPAAYPQQQQQGPPPGDYSAKH